MQVRYLDPHLLRKDNESLPVMVVPDLHDMLGIIEELFIVGTGHQAELVYVFGFDGEHALEGDLFIGRKLHVAELAVVCDLPFLNV